MTALFPLGQTVATPSAIAALTRAGLSAVDLLDRHVSGDWGDMDLEDLAANTRGVRDGTRLLSAYPLPSGETVWVITEWDRSVTTILLPEEY